MKSNVNRVMRALAGTSRSVTAQAVMAQRQDLRADLAANGHLAGRTWQALWGRMPAAPIAVSLARRDLTPDQIDIVVARERRTTVIRELVSYSSLSDEQAGVLLDRSVVDCAAARLWWRSGRVPGEYRERVAKLAGANAVVQHVADTPGLGLELITAREAQTADHASLVALVDARPDLIPEVMEGGRLDFSLIGAACASRHLHDQDAMSWALDRAGQAGGEYLASWKVAQGIAGNPNAGPAVLERAMDARLPGRRLPTQDWRIAELRYQVCGPWEEETSPRGLKLLVLASHTLPCRARFVGALPQLSEQQRRSLEFYLSRQRQARPSTPPDLAPMPSHLLRSVRFDPFGLPVRQRPDGTPEGVVLVEFIRGLEAELDPAGEAAWSTAIALLEDGWTQTVGELVDTAKLL